MDQLLIAYSGPIVAMAICVGTYFWGKNSAIEPVTERVLTLLEEQGFIKTKVNPKTGEKELYKL